MSYKIPLVRYVNGERQELGEAEVSEALDNGWRTITLSIKDEEAAKLGLTLALCNVINEDGATSEVVVRGHMDALKDLLDSSPGYLGSEVEEE